MAEFKESLLPDLTGKVCVVTGANSGIGLEAARMLVSHGATVIFACRNVAKGEAAVQALKERETTLANASMPVMALDLASLASVASFASRLSERFPRLDLLVNNAGVMAVPYTKTADGFEMQFGTNHLGHFALTGRLLPLLMKAEAGRVVAVSSLVHRRGKIRFSDLQSDIRYGRWDAYAQSKLANLLFAFELERRLRASGSRVTVTAAHPGYSATNLQTAGFKEEKATFSVWFMELGNRLLAQSAEMGALPTVYAAFGPDVTGGDYIGPSGLGEVRGYPKKVSASRDAQDLETAARLWEVSERLTGVTYSFEMP